MGKDLKAEDLLAQAGELSPLSDEDWVKTFLESGSVTVPENPELWFKLTEVFMQQTRRCLESNFFEGEDDCKDLLEFFRKNPAIIILAMTYFSLGYAEGRYSDKKKRQ